MTSYTERLADLERERGRPVRVGLVGAGQMGRGLAVQVGRLPGMRLAAAFDVDEDRARHAIRLAGEDEPESHAGRATRAVAEGRPVALPDAGAATELDLDVVLEATGVPGVVASVASRCLLAGLHYVTLNAEMDVTVGRFLDVLARRAGVVYTVACGDEPVAAKELVDFAHDLALEVVCAGKGKNNPFDPAATPDSVAAEARGKRMNPKMLASFVDGSKTMVEMAALSNATGLRPDVVGMHGPKAEVPALAEVFRPRADGGILHGRGRVDYAFGPAPGVFCVVTSDDETVAEDMEFLRMGKGRYWCLYRPYHLANLEAPRAVAMAVLDGRPALRPATATAEVVAVAKRDLVAGDVIDGIGGTAVYGTLYPAEEAGGLLPLGLAQEARVTCDVRRRTPIELGSCELPSNAITHLRALQDELL
ncbi:MAG: oxidoreductase [Actinomycetota bacterium]|nr:oxidoreductase [Actinomycetota bacterium]